MIFERTTKMNFVFVGLGGALGAIGRYAISMIPIKTEFPFLTLITNILGMLYAVVSVVSCIFGIWCGKKIAEFFGG